MPDPVLFDNLTDQTTTGTRLRTLLKGARTLDICCGYLSTPGLETLCDWLDAMPPDARIRLLLGMAPNDWKDWGTTPKAAATFLARHLTQHRQGSDDRRFRTRTADVLRKLDRHRQAGRLEVRQRLVASGALHAKLYLWKANDGRPAGLVGSSNLTRGGLTGQGELNVHVQREANLAPLSAWFDARWEERASYRAPAVLEEAAEFVLSTTRKPPRVRPSRRSRTRTGWAPVAGERPVARTGGGRSCWGTVMSLPAVIAIAALLAFVLNWP